MRSTVGIPLLPAQAVAEGQGGGGCQSDTADLVTPASAPDQPPASCGSPRTLQRRVVKSKKTPSRRTRTWGVGGCLRTS